MIPIAEAVILIKQLADWVDVLTTEGDPTPEEIDTVKAAVKKANERREAAG